MYTKTFFNSFQFHYGLIKSEIGPREICPRELFQFHYGLIKSFLNVTLHGMRNGFNSTMV